MKNNLRNTLSRNYNRAREDIVGRYLKLSEKFVEKNQKKEESLYFSNGIFIIYLSNIKLTVSISNKLNLNRIKIRYNIIKFLMPYVVKKT